MGLFKKGQPAGKSFERQPDIADDGQLVSPPERAPGAAVEREEGRFLASDFAYYKGRTDENGNPIDVLALVTRRDGDTYSIVVFGCGQAPHPVTNVPADQLKPL